MATSLKQLRSKLRDFALSLPEATEDFPWGERVAKVNKKVFVFLGRDMDPELSFGVKLVRSHAGALATPSMTPMRYGLGKSGWVSGKFQSGAQPTFEQLRAWVSESYAAVAPKKLVARVVAVAAAKAAPKAAAKKNIAKKVPAKRGAKAPAPARAERAAVNAAVRAKKRAPKR